MISIPLFRTTRRPPVFTGANLLSRTSPLDSNGYLTAMAKGVNDVLIYYIWVSDAQPPFFVLGIGKEKETRRHLFNVATRGT